MSPIARLLFAALLGASGIFVYFYNMTQFAEVVGGALLILGLLVAVAPHQPAVMRFGHLTWSREELCRHILITGDTGCGKTSSGFHNILFRLSQSLPDWGGLVVGVKGDEQEFLEELLDNCGRLSKLVNLQVRPAGAPSNWVPPHRFNLLSDRSLP